MKENKERISSAILNYLKKNPEAGDTLDGISKWWLEIERIESSVDEVADAIESLMQKNLVKMDTTSGGTLIYKMKKS